MGRIINLKGHTEIWLFRRNGEKKLICDKRNTIFGGIKEGLYQSMKPDTTIPNFAIDDLFTADNVGPGLTQDGKDGIVVGYNNSVDAITTVTTTVSAGNTYGKKWRGEIQFDASYTIDWASLGKGFTGSSGGANWTFGYTYAGQSIADEAVVASDRLVINWEIYL